MKKVFDKNFVYKFSPNMDSVKEIESGDKVTFETKDCFSNQIQNEEETIEEIDFSKANPATGPISIKGAKKGDLIKVRILNIKLPKKGVTVIAPGEGVLGEKVEEPRTFITEISDETASFRGKELQLNPMVGVIGVAPEKRVYPTGSQGKHGGNMDTSRVCVGNSIYFPVNKRGAMLALGDCHASMGDGEVCVSGLEVKAEVETKVELIREPQKVSLEWPLVENKESYSIIASGEDIDEAIENAVEECVDILKEVTDLSWEECYALASLNVDLEFSQVVDPNKTVRATIPKGLLEEQIFN